MSASLVIDNLRGAVVGPLSLAVAGGSCAAITGPSGAGKSLFLRMIADLDPSAGAVALGELGREAVSAPTWRRAVRYVAAEPGWWAETAAAHIAPDACDQARDLAARLHLDGFLFERPIASLSTGERQRFGLVRAFCDAPPALLLDEPSSALDGESAASLEALLRDTLAAGRVIVLVTHDRALADRLGDQRHELVGGRFLPR